MALVCFSWKLLSCKVMILKLTSPWGPSLTTEDTSEKHLLTPWRLLPCTQRKALVTCLLPHSLARLNSPTGGDTWFSSLESKFTHAGIFSRLMWILRVSWNLFSWLHFDSSVQLSVAAVSVCTSRGAAYTSGTTRFPVPHALSGGTRLSTENAFLTDQRWTLSTQHTVILQCQHFTKKPPEDGIVNVY